MLSSSWEEDEDFCIDRDFNQARTVGMGILSDTLTLANLIPIFDKLLEKFPEWAFYGFTDTEMFNELEFICYKGELLVASDRKKELKLLVKKLNLNVLNL